MPSDKDNIKKSAKHSVEDVLKNTEALKEHFDEEKFGTLEQVEMFTDALRETIVALSLGDLTLAQDMIKRLTLLASSKLFKNIGKVTRELHESVKEVQDILDPGLKRIAKQEMKDLTNRLSYASELVKDASDKTLDLLFERQEIATADQGVYAEIASLIDTGDKDGAKAKLVELGVRNKELINDITKISELQIHADLVDQLIKKISKVIGDLEDKLVDLVKHFGKDIVIMEEDMADKKEGLYGPAPSTTEGVVASQDDVDSLLSSLGL